MQHVNAPIARFEFYRAVGKNLRGGLAEHGAKSDAETLYQRGESLPDFSDDGRHTTSL